MKQTDILIIVVNCSYITKWWKGRVHKKIVGDELLQDFVY